MEESFAKLVLTLLAALVIAPLVFYTSSLAYIVFRFPRGTLLFLAKSLSIGLMSIPVAIILTIWAICQVATAGFAKLRSICTKDTKTKKLIVANTAPPHQPEDVVVHLLHGTFGLNSEWVRHDSPLCKAILNRDSSVNIIPFFWSGLNTNSERRKAAESFANKVRACSSQRQYVIAHSHGGNIVKIASERSPDIAQKIRGVCLLSTPFIFRNILKRTGSSFVLIHSIGFAAVLQLPLALVLAPINAYGTTAAGLSMITTIIVEFFVSKRLQSELDKEIETDKGYINFRNVQIFHAVGDEADSVLRFASFLHESCFSLFSQLQNTNRQLSGSKAPYLLTFIILASLMVGSFLLSNPEEIIWRWSLGVVMVCVAAACLKELKRPSKDELTVLVMMALPVGLISFWLAAAKSLAYGDWRLIFCPSIFIYSSETPVGNHHPIKYAPENDGALAHSTHSHRRAIVDVAEWLHSSIKLSKPIPIIWFGIKSSLKPGSFIPESGFPSFAPGQRLIFNGGQFAGLSKGLQESRGPLRISYKFNPPL